MIPRSVFRFSSPWCSNPNCSATRLTSLPEREEIRASSRNLDGLNQNIFGWNREALFFQSLEVDQNIREAIDSRLSSLPHIAGRTATLSPNSNPKRSAILSSNVSLCAWQPASLSPDRSAQCFRTVTHCIMLRRLCYLPVFFCP